MSLWPLSGSNDGSSAAATEPPVEQTDSEVPAVADVVDVGPERPPSPGDAAHRPRLLRNQLPSPPVPPPDNIPPPAPPAPAGDGSQYSEDGGPKNSSSSNNSNDNATQPPPPPQDSLSLAQLRRIVAEFPRTEPIAYDYVYKDMEPLAQEIEEWFVYNFWQWVRLNAADRAFGSALAAAGLDRRCWDSTGPKSQRSFVKSCLGAIQSLDGATDSTSDRPPRNDAIGALVYLVLGRWTETVPGATLPSPADPKVKSMATRAQLDAMRQGLALLDDCAGLPVVWAALRRGFDTFWDQETPQMPQNMQNSQLLVEELINLMTILYMAMQHALDDPTGLAPAMSNLRALEPSLVEFWFHVVATKSRWDESGAIPHTQVLLLFWKSILVVFGGTQEIAQAKRATSEKLEDGKDKDLITASPLDYHVFRQEITSKYPAYVPPQPMIPLEAENTSLLPQLPNPMRHNGGGGILPGPPSQSGGASILHQPVHIATPAPSPPPSPAAGKGGKKQNYQTNQNFPFMYPPLDATSNNAGGKGGAGLQGLLVGRKWEGSDIPASILEAGELFSGRVRMTRATRQLWEERERFLKFDRGWEEEDNDVIDELDLSGLTWEEKQELGLLRPDPSGEKALTAELDVDYGPRPVDQRVKESLDALEKFYVGCQKKAIRQKTS